jgi:hypothetical protein
LQEKKAATKAVRRLSTIIMGAVEDGGWTEPKYSPGRSSPNSSPSKRTGTHLAVEFGESLQDADAAAANVAAAAKGASAQARALKNGRRLSKEPLSLEESARAAQASDSV